MAIVLIASAGWFAALPSNAAILWSRPQPTQACTNGAGEDILHGALRPRDDTFSGTLYFKFRVDPISDVTTEVAYLRNYLASLVLYHGDVIKLGIVKAWDAWGYTVFAATFNSPRNRPGQRC